MEINAKHDRFREIHSPLSVLMVCSEKSEREEQFSMMYCKRPLTGLELNGDYLIHYSVPDAYRCRRNLGANSDGWIDD